MEEMRRRYKRYPELRRKWRVLAGSDEYGFSDLFFYAPRLGIWQVKGESKSPYELVGAGAQVAARKVDDEIRELMEQGAPMPFGLILSPPQVKAPGDHRSGTWAVPGDDQAPEGASLEQGAQGRRGA